MTVAADPGAFRATVTKLERLLREVKKPYANAFDIAYTTTVRDHERVSGGGDSNAPLSILEDERKAQIREVLAEITKITNHYHKVLAAGKVKMELAAGFRVRHWDSLEEKARVTKARERQQGG